METFTFEPEPTPVETPVEPEKCLNCGHVVTRKYCPDCGQEHSHKVVSLSRLVGEFLDDTFSLDSKLLRSVAWLLFRPGFLTNEYNSGRRVRYLSPWRIYVFASVVMLFVISGRIERADLHDATRFAALKEGKAANTVRSSNDFHINIGGPSTSLADLARGQRLKVALLSDNPVQVYLHQQAQLPVAERDNPFARAFYSGMLRLKARRKDPEFLRNYLNSAAQAVPKGMLVLLPVFALLLKVIYIRRKRLYIEHLVFALHCHAFIFTLLALDLFVRQTSVTLVSMAIIAVYFLVAMRRVYRQGWIKTSLKFGMLLASYAILLLFMVLGVFLFTTATA